MVIGFRKIGPYNHGTGKAHFVRSIIRPVTGVNAVSEFASGFMAIVRKLVDEEIGERDLVWLTANNFCDRFNNRRVWLYNMSHIGQFKNRFTSFTPPHYTNRTIVVHDERKRSKIRRIGGRMKVHCWKGRWITG